MARKGISMGGVGFSGPASPVEKYPEIKAHCIVDSHMHIQSGACAPKPLVDYQISLGKILGTFFKSPFGRDSSVHGALLQGKDINIINERIFKDNSETYKKTEISSKFAVKLSHSEKRERAGMGNKITPIFSPVVIMPMDMEYAHLAGYPDKDGNASTIYHHENNNSYYWKRKSASALENEGKKHKLSEKKWLNFKKWKKQFEETRKSVLSYPWQQFFLYHYEPRRWRLKDQKVRDEFWNKGTWDQPFSEVATSQQPGLCLGFKMYPPLGYKPLDPKLPHLWNFTRPDKSDCFYGKCELEGIPILTHCSPGGMTTNEVPFYAELEGFSSTIPNNDAMPDATRERIKSSTQFYYKEFVHPKQWRKVLEDFPKLKLCLAHFGGDDWDKSGPSSDWIREIIDIIIEKDESDRTKFKYPNVYTDLACWDWGNQKVTNAFREILKKKEYFQLRKRILFGTDWYMILVVPPLEGYEDNCRKFKKFIDSFDREGDWFFERFTLLNPFEFYGFDDKNRLKNIQKALEKNHTNPVLNQKGFERISIICDEVKKIRKDIKKWDEQA